MTKGAEMTLEQLYALADEVHDRNNLKPPAELVVLTSGDNYYCVNNENGKYIIGVQAKIAIIILLNR